MRVFLLCSLPLIRCAPNLNCSVLLYKRCYCYEMVWKLLRCSPVMILEDKHRQQWVCFELWTFLASYVLQLINHTSFVEGKYFISMTEKKRNCLLPAINLAQHLCAELWRWLRATYQDTPFLLSSATLDTTSLERIKASLDISGQDVKVLTTSCDRPNIYQQSRVLKRRVDVWLVFSISYFRFEVFLKEHRSSAEFCLPFAGWQQRQY